MNVTREQALELERIESAAWQDMHAAATEDDRKALSIRSRMLAGAFVMSCDREESLLANRVLGLGLHEPVAESTLDDLIAHYRGRVSGFAINLAPFAAPGSLEGALGKRGFGTYFHHLKWWRPATPYVAPATAFQVRRATSDDASAWGSLAAQLFDWSPGHAAWAARVVGRAGWWHGFAIDRGAPVGVAALHVSDGAAWLGFAGTLATHRRRGAQSALLAARIAEARAQGVRVMTLETAPDWPDIPGESLRNAHRAGFHPAYERPSWIWPLH